MNNKWKIYFGRYFYKSWKGTINANTIIYAVWPVTVVKVINILCFQLVKFVNRIPDEFEIL